MTGRIVSPKLFSHLKVTHYTSAVTIQESTPSQSSTGEVSYSWSNLSGHVELSCLVADRGSTEHQMLWGTFHEAERIIALAGSYTDITTEHRAVVGSTNYDILGAIEDLAGVATYLPVRAARSQ